MRFLILSFAILIFWSCLSSTKVNNHNWKQLFNGRDLDGWVVKINGHETGENFGNTFRVKDKIISVRYDQYDTFNDRFGHLYYKTPFSYYHLVIEYRFVGEFFKSAPEYARLNSGVMFHSQDPATMLKDQNWPISVEMQFLGGLGDGKERTTGNMCSPGTNVVINGKLDTRHCINSTSRTYEGEQWVRAELMVWGDSLVKHIINGDTVLQYSKPQIGGNVVAGYRPEMKKDGMLLKEGLIALQSEGQPIDFRKLEIRELRRP
ncbi:MAG: DUF1080 domain-containing protein [Chitinophagaceae bacterium]|nr:DUF1080 domain-containing protein [Chitinophagaceae bacterium]